MAEYVHGLIVSDVADVHALFRELLVLNERLESVSRATNLPGVQGALNAAAWQRVARIRTLYSAFNRELQYTAQRAAVMAVKDIRDRLKATQLRADTDSSPHLRDLIRAAPMNLELGAIATGAVGIADKAELDRAINRRSPGYGTYWRAQEYGTGSGEVPSQVGRVIFGSFAAAGGGDLSAPQAQYAGGGGGPHPVFLTKRPAYGSSAEAQALGATGAGGTRTGPAGMGTIGVEIQPRGFIRFGADAAAVWWRERIAIVQQQAVEALRSLPV